MSLASSLEVTPANNKGLFLVIVSIVSEFPHDAHHASIVCHSQACYKVIFDRCAAFTYP